MAEKETHSQRLDLPLGLHLDVQQEQIDRRRAGQKITLNDLYVELIKKGLYRNNKEYILLDKEDIKAVPNEGGLNTPMKFLPADQFIPDPNLATVAGIVFKKNSAGDLINDIDTTPTVKNLLDQGMKVPDIAKLLGKHDTIIYKAVARLKKKEA